MKKNLLFSICHAIFLMSVSVNAETLSFRSDFYCPFVCDPQSPLPGYAVEVLHSIFEKEGIQIDVKLTDWARSIQETRNNISQGIIGCSKKEAHDLIFPIKTIGKKRPAFFTRRNSEWLLDDPSNVVNSKVGVINGYYYGEELDRFVKMRHPSFKPFVGERPLVQIAQMLASGQIDVFIENATIINYLKKNKSPLLKDVKQVGWASSSEIDLYVAFSPKNPKAKTYSHLFSKGLEEMRHTGELQKILSKYNINDWESSSQAVKTNP